MTYASGHYSYRPIPTATVYASKYFRKPEVEAAFARVEQMPDEATREVTRAALIAFVTVVSDVAQTIDDLSSDVRTLKIKVEDLGTTVEKGIQGRAS